MTITAIRPASITGPDKVRGSADHVNIITRPARGEPITLPFADPSAARSMPTTSPRHSSAS